MVAGNIPQTFLDELRQRLAVSVVVARRLKDLRRDGREWKALSPWNNENTPSFTVNDDKQLWKDFSSGKGGDIFKFETEMTGCTFVEAVRSLAELAGVPMPGDRRRPGGNGDSAPAPAARRGAASTREVTATYDYVDADGGLVYQVCRIEWAEGEGDGSRKKAFAQRRKIPGVDGWVWGLDAATYVRARNGDWYRLTKDRSDWPGERVEVPDEVAHGLYRFDALRDEMALPPDERRIVFSPEGEKDCDTLAAWGLVATDSSGGSKKWSPFHAEQLREADVVVLVDNDKAGREYGLAKAASLRGIAARVRVLDWRAAWAACPEGGDVTDWRDLARGDRDKLLALIDRLPDWVPQAPESSFNAVRFLDLDKPARELEWLIKKVLTRGECSIWYGVPGCGKSFLLTDAALAIARGVSWFGLRSLQGLVVYQAGEGGLGLKRRLRAWRLYYDVRADEDVPFVLLPSRLDLFNSDVDVEKLIAEVRGWAAFYDVPLELVVIDTFSAATPGANENASEDVSKVLQRAHRVASELRCHVAIVHHTPKGGGSPRGHSSLMGNVENAVEVIRHEQVEAELLPGGERVLRDLREFVVRKQKDGEDGLARRFVLRQVTLGKDIDGEDVTSCVVSPVAGAQQDRPRVVPPGYANLAPNNMVLMKALQRAINERGREPPDEIKAARGVRAVEVGDWIDAFVEIRFQDDPADKDGRKLRGRCKKAVERACGEYGWADRDRLNLIEKEKAWVWRTGRKVNGVDAPPVGSPGRGDSTPLLAPGEDQGDIADLLMER